MPDGSLLVVSMKDHRILRWSPEEGVRVHAHLTQYCGGHLNDMVVDAHGRAYAGNFGFDLMAGDPMVATPLARIDPDGKVSVASEPLLFPNGSAITPDGSTLVVSESFGNRMSAFDIAADGSLGPRRDWAVLGPAPETDDVATALGAAVFAPDGMCLDADGAVWVADAVHNRVLRLAEGGEVLDEIETGDGCYACMLGGEDGRTLFLCLAPDFHEDARSAAREARIVSTTVDVGHAGTP
jgi:sugar lactone lactonase YvrE